MNIIEQGFPAHFIGASDCTFVRNTAIIGENEQYIVSTVGNKRHDGQVMKIGADRYYETLVFKAYYDDPYWEADIGSQVRFESDWSISDMNRESDYFADRMHNNVVNEIKNKVDSE